MLFQVTISTLEQHRELFLLPMERTRVNKSLKVGSKLIISYHNAFLKHTNMIFLGKTHLIIIRISLVFKFNINYLHH